MMAPESPVFTDSDDEDLKPGERWASDPVLGNKELALRPRDKKGVPKGNGGA